MKILFVDNSADLQQKWIEPLRALGWGVVRARSIEDADRMMVFHGDALQAIVVSEKFVSFAEKNDLVFVVLTEQWSNTDVLKHQNSEHSALAYLPKTATPEELCRLFDQKDEVQVAELKATGTDGPTSAISLEDYSDVLSKPEATRTSTHGLRLEMPSIVLGGKSADEVNEELEVAFKPDASIKPEVEAFQFDEPVETLQESSSDNRTMILDTTKLTSDFSDVSIQEESKLNSLPDADALDEISSLDDLIPAENSLQNEISLSSTPAPSLDASVVNQFAVNPNPSAQVSDVATLKSYLALREQDVAVLSGQLRSSQERIQQLEMLLKVEKARGAELSHLVSKQEQKIKNYDQEKQVELEVMDKQIEDMATQLKEKTDKVRSIEAKLRITSEEINKVKERVRVDIRRIRVREKELENQLEVLKKDSSALIQARDEKVLELKRKIDLLEFNMELVQEQYAKERQSADELKLRLKDAATIMKQAGGMLEQ